MKTYLKAGLWFWITGAGITTAIVITLYDAARLLQTENRFQLFMRIIIISLITLSFVSQLFDYIQLRKQQSKTTSKKD